MSSPSASLAELNIADSFKFASMCDTRFSTCTFLYFSGLSSSSVRDVALVAEPAFPGPVWSSVGDAGSLFFPIGPGSAIIGSAPEEGPLLLEDEELPLPLELESDEDSIAPNSAFPPPAPTLPGPGFPFPCTAPGPPVTPGWW